MTPEEIRKKAETYVPSPKAIADKLIARKYEWLAEVGVLKLGDDGVVGLSVGEKLKKIEF